MAKSTPRMAVARAFAGLSFLTVSYAQSSLNVEAMVDAAESLLESTMLFDKGWKSDRFKVAAEGIATNDLAAEGIDDDRHGVYGEFPLRGMAQLLAHPAMGSISSFVDIGSGAGHLILGVAAMLGPEASVVGIEASPALNLIAEKAIAHLVSLGRLRPGAVNSILADATSQPVHPTLVSALTQADAVFCYSTAFPSEDGLRLPQLSAVLAAFLPGDSVVITTDKVSYRSSLVA